MRGFTRLTSIGLALLVAGCAGSEDFTDGDLDAKAARRCASKQLTANEIASAAAKAERLAPESTLEERQPGSITVRVYAHVIYDGSVASAQGMLTREQVQQQIDVLNQSFAGNTNGHNSAYRFAIQNPEEDIDFTNNRSWYNVLPGTAAEREMKKALHRGGRADLNLYFANPGQGLLGWATFPWTLDEEPRGENLLLDGVVVLNESRPGGSAEPYNQGDTAVHEVGHWLGLLHTFQGECDGQDGFTTLGDYVKDTPREAGPTFGCVEKGSVDTCPSTPRRPDPVENFMDYTDDACMFAFTRGQALRMNQKFKAFREGRDEEPPPACGNGTVDAGEACDTGIASGSSGACPQSPADCNDGQACTTDEVIGEGCQAQCFNGEITDTADGDGCCPADGNAGNDSDCAATCGDGVVSAGEACDTGIEKGAGSCPTACSDDDACTRDVLLHGGTCQAACVFDDITQPKDGDGCCPAGANAANDDDCEPECGNGVIEPGEACDDGGTAPGDGCDASCQEEPKAPSSFRIKEMYLRDPHIFVRLGVCQDLTNGDVGSLSVNGQLNAQLQRDGDGDGFYDMSPVLLFRPLAQNAPSSGGDFMLGSCRVNGACGPGGGEVYEGVANNKASGTCVSVLAGTTTDPYSPEVDTPVNKCFATAPQTLPIEIQGTAITLHDATIGAVYEGDPATGLVKGLIRGFVTEADAESTIVPLPILGDTPLASLLPGGKDNCSIPATAGKGDKDTGPGGKSGWYFYLNFSAVGTPWAE